MSTTPRVRILSTGSEITTGLYPDTNAQKLSQILLEEGFRVVSHNALPDDRAELARGVGDALRDCELVIGTGGLGPTEDDLNREIVAEVFGVPLLEDPEALTMMADRFVRRGIPMPERNRVQAFIPKGAVTLKNFWGTAPGFFFPPEANRPAFVALPGPSSEWFPMIRAVLDGPLKEHFPAKPSTVLRTIQIAMTPESVLNEVLRDLFHQDDLMLTILAGRGVIRLRLLAQHPDRAAAQAIVDTAAQEVLRRIGRNLPFFDGPVEQSLAAATLAACRQQGATLALAESCTGGMVGERLTDTAGSSDVFLGGWITYSNQAKIRELAVDPQLLESEGAVSAAVAVAMAEGALQKSGATLAAAVTGVAGPGGGTQEKPIGLVHFAVAGLGKTVSIHRQLPGDRSLIREWATNQCLELIRRHLLGIDPNLYLGGDHPRYTNH